MDLPGWICSEHAALADRFTSNVAAHVPRDRWAERPGGEGSSVAHLLLHTAWHADLAIRSVVLGEVPLIADRRRALGLADHAAHTALGEAEDPEVTIVLDLAELARYWSDVHAEVAARLASIVADDLDRIPDIARGFALAGVDPDEVPWLRRLWSDKPASWFVQWEAIGHVQGHLGEMISIRGRMGLSPF